MIWLILALATGLRFVALNQSFWLDEAAQAVLSRAPLLSVNYGNDFQPPLYYVFSHFWMQLGIREEWFLRLPSIIFGLLTIYLVYRFCTTIVNKRVGLGAALFLALSPFHIYYSQEFRMYSLLTLLCLACWMALWHKKWGILSALITLSVFTHYFAFVNMVALLIYVIVGERKELKKALLYVGLGLLPFILWIPTFITQLESARHLVSLWPSWKSVGTPGFFKFLPLTFAKWTVGMISPPRMLYAGAVVIFGLISAIALGMVFKKRRTLLLTTYCFIPLLLAWLGGIWLPAASPARVQFVLPAFYMLLSYGLYQLYADKKLRPFAIIATIFITISHLYFSSAYLFNENNHREDWRGAVSYSDDFMQKNGGIAVTTFSGKWAPMDWYSKNPERYFGGASIKKFIPSSEIKNVVLYTYLFEIFDPHRETEQQLGKNFTLHEEKDFRGVGIVRVFGLK